MGKSLQDLISNETLGALEVAEKNLNLAKSQLSGLHSTYENEKPSLGTYILLLIGAPIALTCAVLFLVLLFDLFYQLYKNEYFEAFAIILFGGVAGVIGFWAFAIGVALPYETITKSKKIKNEIYAAQIIVSQKEREYQDALSQVAKLRK